MAELVLVRFTSVIGAALPTVKLRGKFTLARARTDKD